MDKAAAPVQRYEVEDVFDNIERNINDIYEIGGAFENATSAADSDVDKLLDAYDEYVSQYIDIVRKVAEGDTDALTKVASMTETMQEMGQKADKTKGDFTPEQIQRYVQITSRMAKALSEARQ